MSGRRGRAVVALAVATLVAAVAGTVTVMFLQNTRVFCVPLRGGEAGTGTWSCPDGISYALPALAVSAAAAGLVLLGHLALELRRAARR